MASIALSSGCSDHASPTRLDDANVVLVVVDTLRADHLSFYGHERETAPFVAGLAANGVVFERAHSASSWTAPATASIFTSVYPFQHGVVTGMRASSQLKIELNRIPRDLETLPEAMRAAGYATFGVADNKNIAAAEGFDQGFDRLVNFNYRGATAVNRAVLSLRSELESADRYFLYLHYMDPHGPLHRREPWFGERTDSVGDELAAYESEIRYFDAHLRELFETLGWDANTLLILTSDHGQEWGDHGGAGHGRTLYSEVLDVPLLLHFPRLWPTGIRVSERVHTIDLLPTLRELVGLGPDPAAEGRSLVSLLDGHTSSGEPRRLFAHLYRRSQEIVGDGPPRRLYGIVRGDWKYVRSADGTQLLFDLETDPRERKNLADAEPDLRGELASELARFLRESKKYEPESGLVELSEEDSERLEALGYLQ